jgi:hypothetical protein
MVSLDSLPPQNYVSVATLSPLCGEAYSSNLVEPSSRTSEDNVSLIFVATIQEYPMLNTYSSY